MGKLKIGTRVRDNDGDEGVIVGKSKGYRDVKYETGLCAGKVVAMLGKHFFTAIPANDNALVAEEARAELCNTAYSVGDRVRFIRDNPNGGGEYGRAGEEFIVASLDAADFDNGEKQVEISHPDHGFLPSAPLFAIEPVTPVVAPATTEWTPKVGERVVFTDACKNNGWWFGPDTSEKGGVIVDGPEIDTYDYTVKTDTGSTGYVNLEHIKPLPVAEQPAGESGEVVPAWEPKVGERVRYSGKSKSYSDPWMIGTEGTVESLGYGSVLVDWDIKSIGGKSTGGDKYVENLEPLPTPPKTWAPVVGKFGKTRDGRKVGPIEDRGSYYAGDVRGEGIRHYTAEGVCAFEGEVEAGDEWRAKYDLVAEWPATPIPTPVAVAEATATPAPKWEPMIGETVRVVRTGSRVKENQIGVEFVVTNEDSEWDGERSWYSTTGERAGGWRYKTSELGPVPPAGRKFKVGDVVNYLDGKNQGIWQGVKITKDTGTSYYATCPKEGDGAFNEEWIELATTFKAGDRVVYVGKHPRTTSPERVGWLGVVKSVSEDCAQVDYDNGEWGNQFFQNIALAPSTLTPGATVTFIATGKLSAINENGHIQVTFAGLEPGQNSFALPAKFVSLAK